jgi:tripartite motif-containing protein 71
MNVRTLTYAALAALMTAGPAFPYVFEGKWGGSGRMDSPRDVAFAPSGNVYVADTYKHAVKYYTATGTFLGAFKDPPRGLKYPIGIAVAPNGKVYVTDVNHRVVYFTSTGSYLGGWGKWGSGKGEFDSPCGVAVAPNSNVYVVEAGYELWTCRVQYFTAAGSFLGMWGGPGQAPGKFLQPTGVCVAPNGNVYVADDANARVQYFTARGVFLGMWGRFGSGNGEFDAPAKVAVGPAGWVFVTDYWNDRVQYFTATETFRGKFGAKGSGNGLFDGPYGVAVSNTGARVYVCDSGNDRIQYFNRNKPAVAPSSLGRVKALFR